LKSAVAGAKGKKQSKSSEPMKALSKLARAERKAERRVAELRALLVKAEKKLAKRAGRTAALVTGAAEKPEAPAESPPVPVAVASADGAEDTASSSTLYEGERDTAPSAPAPKRPTARSVKSGTAPAPAAKRTTPNHNASKGSQVEAPTPGDTGAGDE